MTKDVEKPIEDIRRKIVDNPSLVGSVASMIEDIAAMIRHIGPDDHAAVADRLDEQKNTLANAALENTDAKQNGKTGKDNASGKT